MSEPNSAFVDFDDEALALVDVAANLLEDFHAKKVHSKKLKTMADTSAQAKRLASLVAVKSTMTKPTPLSQQVAPENAAVPLEYLDDLELGLEEMSPGSVDVDASNAADGSDSPSKKRSRMTTAAASAYAQATHGTPFAVRQNLSVAQHKATQAVARFDFSLLKGDPQGDRGLREYYSLFDQWRASKKKAPAVPGSYGAAQSWAAFCKLVVDGRIDDAIRTGQYWQDSFSVQGLARRIHDWIEDETDVHCLVVDCNRCDAAARAKTKELLATPLHELEYPMEYTELVRRYRLALQQKTAKRARETPAGAGSRTTAPGPARLPGPVHTVPTSQTRVGTQASAPAMSAGAQAADDQQVGQQSTADSHGNQSTVGELSTLCRELQRKQQVLSYDLDVAFERIQENKGRSHDQDKAWTEWWYKLEGRISPLEKYQESLKATLDDIEARLKRLEQPPAPIPPQPAGDQFAAQLAAATELGRLQAEVAFLRERHGLVKGPESNQTAHAAEPEHTA